MKVVAKGTRINKEWWESLSEPEQVKYIKQHPKSPYRKLKRKSKKSGGGAPEEPKTKFDQTKNLKDLNYNEQISVHVAEEVQKEKVGEKKDLIEENDAALDDEIDKKLKHVKKLSEAIKHFHDDQKNFFRDGQQNPGSEQRRSIGQLFKDKAKGIAKVLKHEKHEWKLAGEGMKKLLKGEKMDDHHKKAIKTVAIHAAIVGGHAAAGGHLVGLEAIPHLVMGFIEHSVAVATGKATIWASADRDPDSYDEDELIEKLIEFLADGIENAPISNIDWVKGMMKSNMLAEKQKASLIESLSVSEGVK